MGIPGSNPVQYFFSFYLLPQVLRQSNLNGGLYFIWSKLTIKDNPSFEEEIVLSWQEFCLGETVRVVLRRPVVGWLTNVSKTRAEVLS